MVHGGAPKGKECELRKSGDLTTTSLFTQCSCVLSGNKTRAECWGGQPMQPVCRQRWAADNAGSAPPAKILFQTGCNKMRAPRTPPNNHKGRCHFCSLQTEAVKQHDCRPSTPVMHLATLPPGGQARCWPPSRNPPQTALPPQHVSQSHHGRGLTAVAAAVPLPHNRQTTKCPFSAVVASTITYWL